jgi:hypothetical protein
MNDNDKRVGMLFQQLPLRLRQRWWKWTYYGKHPATNELMLTIEAFNPELAEYLASKERAMPDVDIVRRRRDDSKEADYDGRYRKWVEQLRPDFGAWDNTDPVVLALLVVVEAQTKLTRAVSADQLADPRPPDVPPLNVAVEARSKAVLELMRALVLEPPQWRKSAAK